MLSAIKTIDLITDEPGLALVVERGEWADPAAAWNLQEKMNAYMAFGLDGEMEQRFGCRARVITVLYQEEPPASLAELLQQIADMAREEVEVRQQRLEQPVAA